MLSRRLAPFLLAVATLFAPLATHAGTVDLAVKASGIFFNTKTLVAGDKVRLYATVKNLGDTDASASVAFFQGPTPIGESQVVSLRAGGAPEEVFVDFVIPEGSFNIRADIRGTSPADDQPNNDSAMTGLFTPLKDSDRDAIADDDDNCPAERNTDQKDTDGDHQGDACDDDDDNDGLSDDTEREHGTSTTKADTDGDGVADGADAYPTDASRTVPEPLPVVQQPTAPTPTPVVKTVASVPAKTPPPVSSVPVAQATTTDVAPTPEPTPIAVSEQITYSPKAVFTYRRQAWNEFVFKALTPQVAGYRFDWSFGDGVTSNRHSLEHSYRASGTYKVTLTVTDPTGQTSTDETTVSVPFFSLGNPLVLAAIGALALLLFAGLFVYFRLGYGAVVEETFEEDDEVRKTVAKNIAHGELDMSDEDDELPEEEADIPELPEPEETPAPPKPRKVAVRDGDE